MFNAPVIITTLIIAILLAITTAAIVSAARAWRIARMALAAPFGNRKYRRALAAIRRSFKYWRLRSYGFTDAEATSLLMRPLR